MAYRIEMSRRTAYIPDYIHHIKLIDETGQQVASSLVWTGLPKETYGPNGQSQMHSFNANTPEQAHALHGAIVAALRELNLPDAHELKYHIKKRKLKPIREQFKEFNETNPHKTESLLRISLGTYEKTLKQKEEPKEQPKPPAPITKPKPQPPSTTTVTATHTIKPTNYQEWLEANKIEKRKHPWLIDLGSGHNDAIELTHLAILNGITKNQSIQAETAQLKKGVQINHKRVAMAGHLVGLLPRPPEVTDAELEEMRGHLNQNLTTTTKAKLPLLRQPITGAINEMPFKNLKRIATGDNQIALAALHGIGMSDYHKLPPHIIESRFGVRQTALPLVIEAAKHFAGVETSDKPAALEIAAHLQSQLPTSNYTKSTKAKPKKRPKK